MDGARLLFSLLVCVLVGAMRDDDDDDDQGFNTITAPEHEPKPEGGNSDLIRHLHPPPLPAIPPPYLLLPVFQHHSAPAVDKALLNPVAERRVLPSALSDILVPQGHEPYIRVTPVNNNHGVEVWCGFSKITVRIDQALLNFRSAAAHFRLGSCSASRAAGSVVYFEYELNECSSLLSVIKGELVYTNSVLYRPEGHGAILRAIPLTLPVQCVYNRFYYSYKIGYLPEFRPRWFRMTMVKKPVFSLSVCDDRWQELGPNASFVLGESVYVQVSAESMFENNGVYVDACHVTASEDSDATQRYDLISNFGCMLDSKRTGSQSRFIARTTNVLRFSLDAFVFADATSEWRRSDQRFYLHCNVVVGSMTVCSTAKSCTYSESEHRWAELSGHSSVCSCCESECRASAVSESSLLHMTLVSSKPWSFIRNNVLPEASEDLNTMLGSVHLHHLHHREEEEPQEEEEESEDEKEEVVLGVLEHQ